MKTGRRVNPEKMVLFIGERHRWNRLAEITATSF